MASRPNQSRRNPHLVSISAQLNAQGRRRRVFDRFDVGKILNEERLRKKQRCHSLHSHLSLLTLQPPTPMLESLVVMKTGMWSDDINLQLEATIQFRILLSIEKSPPIKEVIQCGVVSRFVEFLVRDDHPQLQFEAAWALTNIASGTSENTQLVIEQGALSKLVTLLRSPNDDVREQAVWALGNVAGDSPQSRDLVLAYGALYPLLDLLNGHAKLSLLRNTTWTLLNLCRGMPQPLCSQTMPAFPVLRQLLNFDDEEVLKDACWALFYLSDGSSDYIQAVIKACVYQRLEEIILHHLPLSVLIPALRTIGNIATGNAYQTQCIIDHGALPFLLRLLTEDYEIIIKKEACYTISNITAGNMEQIQAVIVAGLFVPLIYLLQKASFYIKKEAAWAILNATSGGSHEQIKYLVNQNCIKPLCDLLVCPDPLIVNVCLKGLENILKVGKAEMKLGDGKRDNYYAKLFNDAYGLEKVKNLQSHDNNEIHEKVVNILNIYV